MLSTFADLSAAEAARFIAACCASTRWQACVVEGRPYLTDVALLNVAEEALATLPWSDVLEAVGAHARIGDRPVGDDQETRWSRSEQAGTADASRDVAARLRAGNLAYQERFGFVFLISATGKSGDQILAALRERLSHEVAVEQGVVRAELWQIVRRRLARAFDLPGKLAV